MTPKSPKFVRLNMTGEVVEVFRHTDTDVTIIYYGQRFTLLPHNVTVLSPEEEAVHIGSKKSG